MSPHLQCCARRLIPYTTQMLPTTPGGACDDTRLSTRPGFQLNPSTAPHLPTVNVSWRSAECNLVQCPIMQCPMIIFATICFLFSSSINMLRVMAIVMVMTVNPPFYIDPNFDHPWDPGSYVLPRSTLLSKSCPCIHLHAYVSEGVGTVHSHQFACPGSWPAPLASCEVGPFLWSHSELPVKR